MDKPFLITSDKIYSWGKLLDDLNSQTTYIPCFKYDSIYDYFLNLISAIIRDLPIILIDNDINQNEINALGIDKLNQEIVVEKLQHQIEEKQLILLIKRSQSTMTIFTSGTTGKPKEVYHTPQTFLRSVRTSEQLKAAIWGYAYNPTHMAGLQVFFQALINESVIIDLFNKKATQVYEYIEKYGITHISATPTFYRLLLPYRKAYSSVIRITFGGEKSSEQLHQSIIKIFPNAKTNNIYASTEAGALFSGKGNQFTIPQQIRYFVKIKDKELLIHKSLLGKSDSLKVEDDFYATGDVINWINEEQGIFEFESRKNELINVGGYKVNPNEIEDTIREMSGVKNAIVYGKDNSVLGKILCSDIELNTDSNITPDVVKKYLAFKLQSFKVPRIIKIVNKIDITRTGKIVRK